MLRKSFVLATLLVSTTFGAALPDTASDGAVAAASSAAQSASSAELLDLAGLQGLIGTVSPFLFTHTPESKARAISELTRAANQLKSNPITVATDPTLFAVIGNALLDLGQREAAIDLYNFVLTLDRTIFGFSIAQACLNLHKLGQTDPDFSMLKALIRESSLDSTIRKKAISCFYYINEDAHRAEAREMWTSLLMELREVATIEDARKAASKEFLSEEETRLMWQNYDRAEVSVAEAAYWDEFRRTDQTSAQ